LQRRHESLRAPARQRPEPLRQGPQPRSVAPEDDEQRTGTDLLRRLQAQEDRFVGETGLRVGEVVRVPCAAAFPSFRELSPILKDKEDSPGGRWHEGQTWVEMFAGARFLAMTIDEHGAKLRFVPPADGCKRTDEKLGFSMSRADIGRRADAVTLGDRVVVVWSLSGDAVRLASGPIASFDSPSTRIVVDGAAESLSPEARPVSQLTLLPGRNEALLLLQTYDAGTFAFQVNAAGDVSAIGPERVKTEP
jgi:hypothetical protein